MEINKILLLGSSGKLGRELFNKLNRLFNISHNGLKKRKVDITKYSNLKRIILKNKPKILINATGYTNIDLCEVNKKKCLEINTNIIKNIIKIKKIYNLKFDIIHFSTDQLYDGLSKKQSERAQIKINNYYSKTKYLAEKLAIRHNATVFRTHGIKITWS